VKVAEFLKKYHAGNYRLYNLTVDQTYSTTDFEPNSYVEFGFETTHVPALHLMYQFCMDVEEWLGGLSPVLPNTGTKSSDSKSKADGLSLAAAAAAAEKEKQSPHVAVIHCRTGRCATGALIACFFTIQQSAGFCR